MTYSVPAHGEPNWDGKISPSLQYLKDTAEAAETPAGSQAKATAAQNAAIAAAATDATNKANTAQANAIASAATDATTKANSVQTNLNTHVGNVSNPHSVTKAQVGLGNVDNTSDAAKPVSTAQQTALNAKQNISSLESDVAAKLGTSGSLDTALSGRYPRVAGVAAATGVQATDTANIAAAIATLPTTPQVGGTVYLPPGQWLINAPLSLLTGLHFRGSGKGATEIRVQSGNMFAPTSTIHHVTFENLTLSTVGGHLFEFGTTGGLAESRFKNCILVTYADAASLMHMNGTGDFTEVVFDGCEFVHPATATVSAFDLKTSGAGLSGSVWTSCRATGNNCTAVPFWRLEATLGAYVHDVLFRNIVGEQNRGGLVHIYSPNGARFEHVLDWDATGNYTDHIVKVATSATTGGKTPRGVSASNVGTRYGTLNASIHHFDCVAVPGTPVVLDRIGDTTGYGAIPYIIGQSVRDAWGASGSVNFVSSNYTIDLNIDGTVINSGAGVTISLPNPNTVPYVGRKFTIKNTNASAATVNSVGGASIDGAASKSLAQWAAITVTTDGAAWFIV